MPCETRLMRSLLKVLIVQPSLDGRSVMQELHDARLLQELGPGEGRCASIGIILLVIVADGRVQALATVERRSPRILMAEGAFLRSRPDAGEVRVEDAVEPGPAAHAARGAGQRL